MTADPSSEASKTVVAAASVESAHDGTAEELLRLEFGRESDLPSAIVAFVGRMMEQHQAERETFLAALRVYKEETARLTLEVSEARADLGRQIEASRAEREHLIGEFLDRVDQLSAKLSTSTARFNSKLDEKDAIIMDKDHRVEAYAGKAANAQNVIEDMRRSTSWRLTIPVRLASRLLARRGTSGD
ncbi:MAG TPA: hypothetical protein VGG09_00240 [Acidimicrobiales bacterium]